ncbi:MAG: phosphatidylserine decarboxylase family protein [Deltaproteobacteria bacterium]|jgi:phosphatidylserine decarboxylase|nr:phosphatidylserine decarboxylase family protein [Deltaproteobacteria bacterium]
MREPSAGLTPEGLPILLLSGFSSLICALLDWWPPALVMLLLFIFALHFFRDPERVVPGGPDLAVCPADGKVIRIQTRADPLTGEQRQCISVFMNVFSVHVNRMPVSGKITRILYIPGKFFNVAFDKAVDANERCCYAIRDEHGDMWQMAQIAGLVARRIVCRMDEGDKLTRGERFGMIKFGSRVDLYLPPGYAPSVLIGEKVYAGQSVLARKIINKQP